MATTAQRTELRDLIGDPAGDTQTWSNASLDLYIDKNSEDLYAAAAYVLTLWAAKLAREFDFTAPEAGSFSRSQQQDMLLAQAKEYRKLIGSAGAGFAGGGFSVGERTRSDERWQVTYAVNGEQEERHADPGATKVEQFVTEDVE
jgi:hypothetical protein